MTVPHLAFVLAAGHGTRLRPLTDAVAKPAIPFVGRAVLDHVLDGLAAAGVEEAIVNLHHAPESVRALVDARGDRPPAVSWSDETAELLGTGGALVPVRERLAREEDFVLVNGDCVHSVDYAAITRAHRDSDASATLAVRPRGVAGFGALLVESDGTVRVFGSPRRGAADERHFLSVQVVSSSLLDTLPTEPRSFSSFADWYPEASRTGHRFRVHESDAEWHAMDSRELYLASTAEYLRRRGSTPHVDASAEVARTATIDPDCAVHAGCHVAAGAILRSTVLLPGARVGEDAVLERCIVASGTDVPAGATASDEIVSGAETPA